MRIKKFIAPTAKDALNEMRKELGSEAVILSQRSVKMQGSNDEAQEIVAAIDDEPSMTKRLPALPPSRHKRALGEMEEKEKKEYQNAAAFMQVFDELALIKQMIRDTGDSVKYRHSASLGTTFGKLYADLIKCEYSEQFALKIIGDISAQNLKMTYDKAKKQAREIIADMIKLESPVNFDNEKKIFAFIGPTGSGKTSSLIKLSVISSLLYNIRPMIISCDVFKVGGVEQLQTYASIAQIPFKAAYAKSEFDKIIEKAEDVDAFFIDTVGRSALNKGTLQDIAMFFDKYPADKYYLMLQSNLSKAAIKKAIASFSIFKPISVILTKTDEAEFLGAAIEALKETQTPLAYICDGQKTPDDIQAATKQLVAKLAITNDLAYNED